MSCTNSAVALQMPSHYVPVTEDEMEYVDGGYTALCDEWYGWHKCTRSSFAYSMDVLTTIASVIVGLSAASTVKDGIKKYGTQIFGQKIFSVGQKLGIAVGSTNTIVQAMANGNWSIGNLVAYLADRFDRGGLDGYVEWHGWGKY